MSTPSKSPPTAAPALEEKVDSSLPHRLTPSEVESLRVDPQASQEMMMHALHTGEELPDPMQPAVDAIEAWLAQTFPVTEKLEKASAEPNLEPPKT